MREPRVDGRVSPAIRRSTQAFSAATSSWLTPLAMHCAVASARVSAAGAGGVVVPPPPPVVPPPGAGGFRWLVTAESPWLRTALPHAVRPPSEEICAALKLFWQVCLALSSADSVWVTGPAG